MKNTNKNNYNTAIDNQYSIFACIREDEPETCLDDEYVLMFSLNKPMYEREGLEADFILGKEDLANIARAYVNLCNMGNSVTSAVKKKYAKDYTFDKGANLFESKCPYHREGLYTLTVEKNRNRVLNRANNSHLYKLTWNYNTVFGNKDSFVIVLRESDFVNLGIVACKMLEGKTEYSI